MRLQRKGAKKTETTDMKPGDTIKCEGKLDALKQHNELAKQGIQTDFLFEKDNEKGIWLIIL